MATELDANFYNRADAIIHLANEQLSDVSRGKVSASCMYATARFNAWVSACGHSSAAEMNKAKEKTIEYFLAEYREMLEENLNDYIDKFDSYIKPQEA